MSTTASAPPPAPSVDVAALEALLDGRHADVRRQVREQLSRPEFASVVGTGISRDEYRRAVLAWAEELADQGGTALQYPREHGGDANPGAAIAAFETTAHGDLSLTVKVGVQFGLFGGAVLNLGTARHHDRWLRDIATLRLPGCFAMTETGHGSDVQSVRTVATYEHGTRELVVHTPDADARKDYIGNALHGRMAAVFCQLVVDGEGRGVHCVVVPLRDASGALLPGVGHEDCGEKLGLEGVDNGRLWFDHVRVPVDHLLDRYAQITPDGRYTSPIEHPGRRFFTMLGTLVMGRVCVGAAGLSASKNALTIAVRYANRRRQFGPPQGGEEALLLDYRTHQRRLLPLLARTYALHFAQERLTDLAHTAFTADDPPERDQRVLEALAAGIKATATWHATETIQECREACGGAGYLAENRFAALKADSDIFTTFEGDNTVLMQLVAKSLLTDYKDQFEELDAVGMVGFVTGQVVETILERSFARQLSQIVADVIPGNEEAADPRERDYQLTLLRWREEHITSSAARRLKRWTDEGHDAFAVFQSVQDHVVEVGRAHLDRVLLEAFGDAVARCEQPELAAVLDRLCDLYAVSVIHAHRGWYLEHGRMTPARAKAFRKAIGRLCFELRPDAERLVDAFGIPDVLLGAPIALDGR